LGRRWLTTFEEPKGRLFGRKTIIRTLDLTHYCGLRLVLFVVPWCEHRGWEEDVYIDPVEEKLGLQGVG